MTTICSSCNRNISKNEKTNDKFVICRHCNKYTPKKPNIELQKEVINMTEEKQEKEVKEKKLTKNKQIMQLFSSGKTKEEIEKETGIKRFYINYVLKKNKKE